MQRGVGRKLADGLATIVVCFVYVFLFSLFPAIFAVSIVVTHPEIPIEHLEAQVALSSFMALLYLPMVAHSLSGLDSKLNYLRPGLKAGSVFLSTFAAVSLIW